MLTRHLLLIFAIVGSLSELQILPMRLPILPLFGSIKGNLLPREPITSCACEKDIPGFLL